jgi:hypothetical protein
MRGLDARDLLGGQFVAPNSNLTAAEEQPARSGRLLTKPLLLLLPLQFGEIGVADGTPDVLVVRRAAGKIEGAAKGSDRVYLHILVADQVHRNVGLIEPACDMGAPAGQLLPVLTVLPIRPGAEAGVGIVHERDRRVDVAAIVIGDRGRYVARVAHDQDGAIGAGPAGEQRFALRRQRIGVVHFHEADRRRVLRRIVFIVIGAARQFLVDARPQAIDLVMGEQAGVDQQQMIERAARAGDAAALRQGVDVDRLAVFGG